MKTQPSFATVLSILRPIAILLLFAIPRIGLAGVDASISCGQTVANTTTNATQNDVYTYTATGGQMVAISLYGPLGLYSPYPHMNADIYSPGGQIIATVQSGNYNTGGALILTLTNTGTYTILVHANNYSVTGSYSMSIQSVTGGGCNSTPIACGQSLSASTSYNSEMDAYSYDGTAGQELVFGLYGPLNLYSPYQAMNADIYSPDGQLLGTVGSGNYNTGGSLAMTLTNSGIYTILVHCNQFNGAGGYSMSIQSVTGGGCNSTPIACGQTIATNTSFNSEIDAYSYSGTAGQELVFGLYGPLNLYSPYQAMNADIYGPGGQYLGTVESGNYNTGGALTMTLTNSGIYTILVHCNQLNGTGSYSMSIQSATGGGCNSTSITCGQSVSAGTSYNSEMDAYTYAGTAGQELAFALYGPLNLYSPYQAMNADIYSPEGQYLGTVESGNYNTGGALVLTLTNTGVYTILVHCNQLNGTGGYSMSIQSFTGGGCDSTAVSCGQTVSAGITDPSQMNTYAFATSGGTVIFSFTGYSGAHFDLYGPAGNYMFTGTSDAAVNTNLAGGIYTFLVHDANFAGTGGYGFTATCIGSPCNPTINPTGPISVGPLATNGTVVVTDDSGCGWTATANVDWIHITAGSSGSGSGTVNYSVDSNPVASARAGTITIVPSGSTNGFSFIVSQANPVTFIGQDVGEPGAPGSFSYSNGVYTVNGSGEGTDGSADVFYYLYETVSSNAQIVARLTGLQGGDPRLAEAGIMFRQGLDPGSEQVSLSVNESTNVIFRRRLAEDAFGGANTFQGSNYVSGTNEIWLRIMRMGNTFVAHCSTNGLNWQYLWFTTVTMTNPVDVGLEVTAHHYGDIATATFDNVSAGGLTPLSGIWPLPGPLLLLGGQNWGPAEFQRIGGFEFLLGGVVGDYFSINSSTNLGAPFPSWRSLGTVTNTYGVVPIIDAQSLTNSTVFYGAKKLGGP